jgi:PadR family transcriptional regulator, phenolic acid-responsive transcriptional regulator
MARCNKSLYAILGVLSKGEMSGYDIKNVFNKLGKFHWSESNAQIYPNLKKMEAKGCVTSRLDEASGARQCRRYQLTDTGRQNLIEWLEEPCEFPLYREEILLKLSLGHNLPIEKLIAHVEHYKAQLNERLLFLDEIDKHIATTHAGKPQQPFLELVYQHHRLVLPAKIKWCEQTIAALKSKITVGA